MNYNNKDLIIQAGKFIWTRLQHRCLPVINTKFKNTYFEKNLPTADSENLSGAAILIFRKYLRKSSLSAFCEIVVL